MASKINSVTIISQLGVRQYYVGGEYGGLKIDRIEDASTETPRSVFIGLTSEDEIVFEAINAPVDVAYEKV